VTLLDLEKRIEKLSPGDRLRLAAVFIDRGELELAEVLAAAIVEDLRAFRLLRSAP